MSAHWTPRTRTLPRPPALEEGGRPLVGEGTLTNHTLEGDQPNGEGQGPVLVVVVGNDGRHGLDHLETVKETRCKGYYKETAAASIKTSISYGFWME